MSGEDGHTIHRSVGDRCLRGVERLAMATPSQIAELVCLPIERVLLGLERLVCGGWANRITIVAPAPLRRVGRPRRSMTATGPVNASVVAYVLTRAGSTRLAHATGQPARGSTYRHRPIRLGTEWHHLIAVTAALHMANQGGGLLLRLVQEEELRAGVHRSPGSCATNSVCLPDVIAVVRTRDRSIQHIQIEVLSRHYRGKRRRKKGQLDSTTVLAAIDSSTARRAEAVLGRTVLIVDRPK